jgi:hypothetical protein
MTKDAEEPTPTNPPGEKLEGKVRALRRRMMSVEAGTGGATAGMALIGMLMFGMLVDWRLELPWFARLVWISAICYVVFRILNEGVLRRLFRAPDIDAVALMVERAFPKFGSRLISALQLGRPGALNPGESGEFVRMLVEQTEAEASGIDFTSIVKPDAMRVRTAALLFLVGLSGVLFGLGGETARVLMKRSFLSSSQIPRDTMITKSTGDLIIGRGDPVLIEATATGIIPDAGRVMLDFDSTEDREFEMEKSSASATYTRRLESVQDSFNYVVYLNDGRSALSRVEVVARPTVAKLQARQEFPDYTGLDEARRSLADLSLLSGSRLKLAISVNKPVTEGYLQLHGITNRLPLIVTKDDPAELAGVINVPATNLTGFSVHTIDEHGLASRDEVIYRVDVLADRAPIVRITYPERREELITQTARMLIAFEAQDDFAVGSVHLAYSIDRGTTNRIELELANKSQRLVKRRYDWRLGDLKPPIQEDSAIEYWIEVHDNNNVTGPGFSATERYIARVVSSEEKRQDLMNRVGDSLSSIDEAASDQESLNQRLGDLIRTRAETPENP